MIIKKKQIGTGKPLLCVPVTETTASGIVETISRLSRQHTEAIEWRLDYYSKSDNPQMVTTILQEVSHLLQETILIVTYRTKAEGGMGEADPQQYESILLAAARTGVPDFTDLEFAMCRQLPMLLGSLKACDTRVIASYHNFDATPSAAAMTKKLKEMFASGADIAKIAVMPHDFSDVCDLLKVSCAARNMKDSRPVIAISMGQEGAVTRLFGEVSGSCLTFVTDGPASAPGQMSYEKTARALEAIHACITEGTASQA